MRLTRKFQSRRTCSNHVIVYCSSNGLLHPSIICSFPVITIRKHCLSLRLLSKRVQKFPHSKHFNGCRCTGRNDPNNLPPTTMGNQESETPKQSRWSKWLEYLRYQGDWLEETRGSLMVVATVITTITFQPALSPPGGFWQNDIDNGTRSEERRVGKEC